MPERPNSPTESIVSTTNSVSFSKYRWSKSCSCRGLLKNKCNGLRFNLMFIRRCVLMDLFMSLEAQSPMSMSTTLRGSCITPSILPTCHLHFGGVFDLFEFDSDSYLPLDVDGQELGISNLLEHLYLENFYSKISVRKFTKGGSHSTSQCSTNIPFLKRTESSLLAILCSHSEAITGTAVSTCFFPHVMIHQMIRQFKVWETGT